MTTLDAMLLHPVDTRAERLDRISARAQRMHFGRAVLSLIALLFVGLGRVTYAILAGLWFVATWCAAAVAEGWNEARAKQAERPGDSGA